LKYTEHIEFLVYSQYSQHYFKMNSNTAIEIDEFGRDVTLRKQESLFDNNTILSQDIMERYKKMSWAEISWEIEEEEERIKEIEENERQKVYKAIDSERKELLTEGKYELEEGEILE